MSNCRAVAETRSIGRGECEQTMIQLTRLNNQPLMVNCDLIKFVERSPDTVLTLVTGEKIVVRESSDEVLQKIVQFRRSLLSGLTLQSVEHATDGCVAASTHPSEPKTAEENS